MCGVKKSFSFTVIMSFSVLFVEDKMFWKAIVELGLVDEFFREIKSKLDGLKHSMIKNYVPIDGKTHTFIMA